MGLLTRSWYSNIKQMLSQVQRDEQKKKGARTDERKGRETKMKQRMNGHLCDFRCFTHFISRNSSVWYSEVCPWLERKKADPCWLLSMHLSSLSNGFESDVYWSSAWFWATSWCRFRPNVKYCIYVKDLIWYCEKNNNRQWKRLTESSIIPTEGVRQL